jgi:hypothetical protein
MARAAARIVRRLVPTARQSNDVARAAGRIAGHWMPKARPAGDFARQSGLFVKHVLPAAAKPVHSLWHQILGFVFLFFAGSGSWWLWRHPASLEPGRLAIVIIFIVVMGGYGISSIRKSRRISRS